MTSRCQDNDFRFSHLCNRHLTVPETGVTTFGTRCLPVHPGIPRNRLREASVRVRRQYVGPPLTKAHHLCCMACFTAHAQRFSMRQWGRVLLLTSPVSLFFAQMVDVALTDVLGKSFANAYYYYYYYYYY